MGNSAMQNEALEVKKPFGRSVLICLLCSVVVSVCLLGLYLLAEWFSVSENGSSEPVWNVFLVMSCVAIGSILSALGGFLMLISKKTRRQAVCLIIAIFIYLVTFSAGLIIGKMVYVHGFAKLAERSKPLIESIKLYEKDHGQAPSALEELIPDYIDEVPPTGMGIAPKYEYNRSEGIGEDTYWGNPWQLVVNVDSKVIGCHKFVYAPNQNYPDNRNLRKITDWVYLDD